MPLAGELEFWFMKVGERAGVGWDIKDGLLYSRYQIDLLVDDSDGSLRLKDADIADGSSEAKQMLTIGFGLDYNSGKIFVTKDGIPFEAAQGLSNSIRYQPAISAPPSLSVDVVFKKEDFKFAEWNAPIEDIEETIWESVYGSGNTA
ncbi:hypothetical protein ABW20_dc0105877 [Dactylellina cionopaga]|nr:hypothetical protein ABW20_dc0105877 [Dactylellina cionopaga]